MPHRRHEQETLEGGFDFLVTPLAHPRHRRCAPSARDPTAPQLAPFARSDLLLNSSQWSSQIVGKTSPWIDADSVSAPMRRDSEAALRQELMWAAHLSLHAVLLPAPALHAANYARVVNQFLGALTHTALWVRVPVVALEVEAAEARAAAAAGAPPPASPSAADADVDALLVAADPATRRRLHDPFEAWANLRALCEGHPQLGVCLHVGASLPPPAELARWVGEPVRAVVVTAAAFTTNKRGFPVLPRPHQEFVTLMLRRNVQVILRGGGDGDGPGGGVSLGPDAGLGMVELVAERERELEQEHHVDVAGGAGTGSTVTGRGKPPGREVRGGVSGREGAASVGVGAGGDPTPAEAAQRAAATAAAANAATEGGAVTSAALAHPLRQHWEYVVYLFRRIPPLTEQEAAEAGYRDYLQAPLQPLMDNLESATYETFEKDASKYIQYEEAVLACLRDRVSEAAAAAGEETVLMVVGAGRGPLVRASLRASDRCGRPLRVYAVEKNPNAVITLQSLVESEGWGDRVTVIAGDMREWAAAEQADVLVSELLGSFGDNELSPECLDGAQRFLKPGGVSIPQSYTSYLAPITCSKLWNDAKAYNDLAHMETPYVVKLHRYSLMAEPLPVFTFEHPNHDRVIDNTRYEKLRFSRLPDSAAATLHGFSGYFDARLYSGPAGTVHCSIYPPTHTTGPTGENMFSWFPIYFPLRYPVHVPAGQPVEAHMWRCVGPSKVWYEWAVTAPEVGPVHNANGRSYWVGL